MPGKKSNSVLVSVPRSLTEGELGANPDKHGNYHPRSSSNPEGTTANVLSDEAPTTSDSSRYRSKDSPTELDVSIATTTTTTTNNNNGFNLFQSIKDLTHQELNRANPLGLLGKEVIYATGTTHCPEPVPPDDKHERASSSRSSSTSTAPMVELDPPQQLHFSLTDEEKIEMQRRRSTTTNHNDVALPPCPAEFITASDDPNCQPHLFSPPSPSTMLADFIPDTMTINVFEVFIYAWGVFAFFFDMITDLVLAHAYYLEGAYWLFILTLMCVILPNLTLSVFSLVWYIDSSQLKAAHAKDHQTSMNQTETSSIRDQPDGPVSRIRQQPITPERPPSKTFQFSRATADVLTWIIRIVILVLQLDLCLKYIRGLYYTWKGFQKRHDPKWKRFYLTKQILIDADIALLRVFDCFMDSGSQVILQLYIMLRLGSSSMKFDTLFAKQCLSIISSLGSLAYALSGYSRCWRHMQLTHSPQGWPQDKPAPQLVSWWSTIMQWFWYLFLITPRVLALAMFAATFRSWFWIILVAHWFGMLFWILRFRTIFCISDHGKYNPREAIFEKCYNLVCSYIFIFCYMNLRKGDTRLHYIAFYTIYYIENISFSIIYAIHSAESNIVLKYSLVSFVCVGFWLAILFQLIYYRFLHPSSHVRLNTKENIESIRRYRLFSPISQVKRSKSCEDMIDGQEVINSVDACDTVSLPFNKNATDERWYNRFSKENRQILISQQQAIDQKVKLNRAQRQSDESSKRSSSLFEKIFRTPQRTSANSNRSEEKDSSRISTNFDTTPNRRPPFFNVSITRTTHPESYSKIIHEDEEDFENCGKKSSEMIDGENEMILTAATLNSSITVSNPKKIPSTLIQETL